MMTIILITIFIVIVVVVFSQFSRKSFVRTTFNKLNAKPLSISIRLFYYVLLAGLSVVTPYILMMIFIIAQGDREGGMVTSVIPSLLSVQIIFGLIFIKHKLPLKLLLTIVLTALTLGLVWLGMTNKLIKTGWDLYEFWDLSVTNFLAGLIIWETYFQINKRF